MRDTIKPAKGYSMDIHNCICTILDGDNVILKALLRSYNDYLAEKRGNECFVQYEVFTTNDGQQFIYWVDWELDADYITRVPNIRKEEQKHATTKN